MGEAVQKILVISICFIVLSPFALFAESPRNQSEIAFYEGLLAFKKQDYPAAEKSFEESLRLDPSNTQAAYFLEQSRLRQKEYEKKEKKEKEKAWGVYGSLFVGYDSNVSLDPQDITVATLPSDESDIRIGVRGGGLYHLIQKGKYRLTAEAFYDQAFYPDLDQFDYGLAHAEIRNQFRWGDFFLSLPASYEFSLLGSSAYLQSAQLSPSASYLVADRFLTQITPRFRLDFFFQTLTNPSQDRDARNLRPEVAEYFFFDQKKRYFKVFYSFEKNWADGDDWDYNAHTVGGAASSPLVGGVSVYAYGSFTIDKSFDHIDSVLGVRRDDTHQNYGIRFSRKIINHLSAAASYDFRHNGSNIDFFRYNRHVAGVTLETSF